LHNTKRKKNSYKSKGEIRQINKFWKDNYFMPAKDHFFGTRKPKKQSVRRVRGSQSFKRTSKTTWQVKIGSRKENINVGVSFETQRGFDLAADLSDGTNVGILGTMHNGRGSWSIFDRFVEPEYRGFNIGRNLFRLAEIEIKKRGGKKIEMHTNQPSVLRTVLKIGYTLTPFGELKIKSALKIPIDQPLPKKAKLLDLLTDDLQSKLGRITKPTITKKIN
jgi:hypothetical protein